MLSTQDVKQMSAMALENTSVKMEKCVARVAVVLQTDVQLTVLPKSTQAIGHAHVPEWRDYVRRLVIIVLHAQ